MDANMSEQLNMTEQPYLTLPNLTLPSFNWDYMYPYWDRYLDYKSYHAFGFERVIYLYIWGILVGMTLIVNVFVWFVLTRKALRNATNMLLVAIAISDTLTGLVTLPSYIMVYTNYQSLPEYEFDDAIVEEKEKKIAVPVPIMALSFPDWTDYGEDIEEQGAYLLSGPLCEAFMFSKYYLSKVFHTISIWLTLYLGIQRFVCVKYPFATKIWFTKKTHIIVGVCIVLAAPILHVYHLIDEKGVKGSCVWVIEEPCTSSCAHMMATLLLMHVIPCTVLTVTTAMFVYHILHNRINSRNDQRAEENRRVSKIVIAITIVFLIPEVPYAMFLVYLQILANTDLRSTYNLEVNRAIHTLYEVFMVLMFNANFYIYTFMNKRFRRELKGLFVCRGNQDATGSKPLGTPLQVQKHVPVAQENDEMSNRRQTGNELNSMPTP